METKKLIDCCEFISDGDHLPPPKSDSGVPFITISNITGQNKLSFEDTMFVPESYYNGLNENKKAKKDDILYSVVGSFGKPVYVDFDKQMVFQRHIAILRPKRNVNARFIYYTMLNPQFYKLVAKLAIGCSQRTVTLDTLRNIEVNLPDKDIQDKMVGILSLIDVVNRIKPDNEQIYYIIDAINDAINAGKQISFQYYDYTGLKKKVLKNKGEVYKLSPYKLLWCGDYYYVLGYSEKKNKVINFRVDRIASKPEILDKDIIPMPDDFDIENYTKEVFFMFSGEKVLVDLRCDNSLMKTMVDRFGEDVTTLAYDMTSFRVQTEVSASPTFFGWVFGFNGKVQILAPESVKEQYRQMIAQADEDMQESE